MTDSLAPAPTLSTPLAATPPLYLLTDPFDTIAKQLEEARNGTTKGEEGRVVRAMMEKVRKGTSRSTKKSSNDGRTW